MKKIIFTLLVLFFGTICFGVIRDLFGQGQHFVSAAMVFLLFIIWSSGKEKTTGD